MRVNLTKSIVAAAAALSTATAAFAGGKDFVPNDPVVQAPPAAFECAADQTHETRRYEARGRKLTLTSHSALLSGFVEASGPKVLYRDLRVDGQPTALGVTGNAQPTLNGSEAMRFNTDDGSRLTMRLAESDGVSLAGASYIYTDRQADGSSVVVADATGPITMTSSATYGTGLLVAWHEYCQDRPDNSSDSDSSAPGKDRGDIGNEADPDAGTGTLGFNTHTGQRSVGFNIG